jgi:hypothetical protein
MNDLTSILHYSPPGLNQVVGAPLRSTSESACPVLLAGMSKG